jgi:Nucleotidyl transferase of unknown function (DUF2204)
MPIEEKPLPVSSSKPPVFSPGQEALFREVLELMQRNHIQCVVSGAFALHEHTGIWRDTKDLDLFMPAQEVCKALRLLEQDGFETEIKDKIWLAKAKRGDFFVDLITGMSNAVVRVDYSWIKRASKSEIFGIPMRVLAPEELIASKVFVTRRERFDGADICHVIYGTRGEFDWRRLMHLMGEHWEMLLWSLVLYQYIYPGFSNYVPREVWDELLQRFRVELDHPNTQIQFRGSLIDENMFAIDVAEWGWRNVIEEYRQTADVINPAAVIPNSEEAA